MAFKTMQQLITETEKTIYQSAGSSVQIYSEDILLQHLQDAFNHVFKQRWWPRFMVRENLTLDGTTGQPTVAPNDITDYSDISGVFHESSQIAIPELPRTYNTMQLTGTGRPRFLVGTTDTKLFRVYPLTATGVVQLVGRAKPADFAIDSTVPFDDQLLRHYAAWSYFTDDGSNPSAAAKHYGLFESYFKLIEDGEFAQAVPLNGSSDYIPDRWTEVG